MSLKCCCGVSSTCAEVRLKTDLMRTKVKSYKYGIECDTFASEKIRSIKNLYGSLPLFCMIFVSNVSMILMHSYTFMYPVYHLLIFRPHGKLSLKRLMFVRAHLIAYGRRATLPASCARDDDAA